MSQAIVQRACAKLSSALVDETVARLNFTADLRDTLEAFDAIQPMLDKAEMQPFMDSKVSFWLQRACNAAYKTIDTVDELQDARPQPTATMTRMLPRLAIMKNAMAIQVQETKKLVMWVQEYSRELSGYIADKTIIFQKVIEERKTGPVFEEAMVLKRGSDKQRIIAALLSTEPNITQEHITILPIFGFPGSGKTTLAQMVFNDTHSLLGYDFRAWVHVSPHFNFHTIGKFIICQVSGRGQEEISHSSSDVEGMESIMKRLHKLLDGKKVLLVLDELWEEDPIQLQLLKSMLTFLGDKMDVIVTTCNQAVARKTCTVEPYRLKLLSDETCWEIIKKSIRFEAGEEELEKIGRKITSKCWGVPSIARQYAGMLDSSRDANKWKRTMQMNIWSWGVPSALSSLELCYMSMPPDLRLCFDNYCAVFPTGHNIVKDDLVQQWIALHLVEQSDILSAAQIAEKHITRLQDMAFLQTAELDHATGDDKGAIVFTMHDMMHHLGILFLPNLSYRQAINPQGGRCGAPRSRGGAAGPGSG
uniref:NB-ARC domain-containing protein n=2 Tax=Triticum aestivum TaxID=4565 RepID=A0A3B6C0M7_WHEAT